MEITIRPANENDSSVIVAIGKIAVEEAHRDSAPPADLNQYLEKNYNDTAIKEELRDAQNIYHLIYCNEKPAGFSKIVLNAFHENVPQKNATKLDRIYLLKEFYNLKLGYRLLSHNVELSKQNNQSGMWLFTWTGNQRAIDFYLKAGFVIIGTHQFKVSERHSNPNHHMFLRY